MRQVLEFQRLTPEPGPDADAVTHEFVATMSMAGDGALEIEGIAKALASDKRLVVRASNEKGETRSFTCQARIDTPEEALYYQHGGILPYVLRQLL